MYVDYLTEEDKTFGRNVWETLRHQTGFPAVGSLWLYEPDSGSWNLVIASPRVDEIGARDAYRELAVVIQNVPSKGNQFLKLRLVGLHDPTYTALRSVFGSTASVDGALLGDTMVNGVFVEGAYLYEVR